MLKRTMASVIAIAMIAFAGAAMAQSCTVAVYADAVGTQSYTKPTQFKQFDLYLIIRAESAISGVAWDATIPSVVNPSLSSVGPGGGGLSVEDPNGGQSTGLGQCAVGFNGNPVQVAQWSCIALAWYHPTFVHVGPNVDQNPTSPVFVDCADNIHPCDGTVDLILDSPIANDDQSFGAVKSLYGN